MVCKMLRDREQSICNDVGEVVLYFSGQSVTINEKMNGLTTTMKELLA